MSKLWGGRFEKGTHHDVEVFTASIGVDARLWSADLRGSMAHARMLGEVGVLTSAEADQIVFGLKRVHARFESGKVELNPNAEDIHSEIEKALGEEIGPLAGKLHTGRSRNDQVATATRLYLREEIDGYAQDLKSLGAELIRIAEAHVETLMPGLTHTQHAQPVSLAHHLMAYFWMFSRDQERLGELRKRVNQLPLGSAALAGTSYPLDRQKVAKELGFDGVIPNSLDAVSDRDFVIEFLSQAALTMTHLSRLSEELILWSAPEFAFVELDDQVTTGSSIMPQKKNPDVAELIRGRAGKVSGALVAALMMMKGLPLSYNRDMQEDKEQLFIGLDTARTSVRLMKLMLESAKFNSARMAAAVRGDFSNATDLADHLVRKGLPFREAHEVVGRVVRGCLESKTAIEDLTLADLKKHSPLFDESVLQEVQPLSVMRARATEGGTGPAAVRAQIEKARRK
ncbi:MAG: argininosuccinate lyase [Oligoflexia bacterium]|nr:argininosuccinate lyase [Oligoflexia bacterium]